jgi:hypothetical protein
LEQIHSRQLSQYGHVHVSITKETQAIKSSIKSFFYDNFQNVIGLLRSRKKLNSSNWIILWVTNALYMLILVGLGFALYSFIYGELLKVFYH